MAIPDYPSTRLLPTPRRPRQSWRSLGALARPASSADRSRRLFRLPAILAGFFVALVLADLGGPQRCRGAEDDAALVSARELSKAFRKSAKTVIPTVVKITTSSSPRIGRGLNLPNPFGEDRFGRPPGDPSDEPNDEPQLPGLGSGVIIDAGGVILTNEHVVNGAADVLVELADGRQFKASDVKIDPQSDLAIVRIEADGPLPAAKLGDSDALDIGDWVLAIGNPFDLDLTVSAGIISSKGRVLPSTRRAHFLQTDAAINPGNSGGPLVNLDGEVVGINTAIASASGVYEGVGFAIPSNLARWVADQLIAHGRVRRAYLGVAIAEVSPQAARQLGVAVRHGVLVSEVFPNSPAAKAELRAGDVITAFAGRSVARPRELQELVERAAIDSTQSIRIVRDGRTRELSITVEALPDGFDRQGRSGRIAPPPEQAPNWWCEPLGIELAEPATDGFDEVGGLEITRVAADGPAATVGLQPGMRVLRIGSVSVGAIDQFRSELRSAAERIGRSDAGLLLMVQTDEGKRFVCLPLP